MDNIDWMNYWNKSSIVYYKNIKIINKKLCIASTCFDTSILQNSV